MGRYKPYERYKDSGVEWIGEVPEHWEVKKFSWLFGTIGSGTTPNSQNESYYDGNINWVVTGELIDGEIGITNKQITESALRDYSALNVFEPGTILMALYGATIGKLGILCVRATTNQACCAMANPRDNVNPLFVYYWLLGLRQFIISLSYGGGQPNISQQVVRNLRISLPPNNEQQAIADFLDQKTSEIDCLVADREKLVSLLQEYRQAIISEAVTKGLNPDVKMKDLGVEWIGEIPEHWEVYRVKRKFRIINGATPSSSEPDNWDGDILWVTPVDLSQNDSIELYDSIRKITRQGYQSCGTTIIPPGSLVLSTRAPIGYVTEAGKEMCTNQGCKSLVKRDNFSTRFFYYHVYSAKTELQSLGRGTTFLELGNQPLGDLVICFPPANEQQAIADYLDQKTSEIDDLISGIQESIDKLISYRQSLISEAVTGKIDVRGVI